MMIVLLAATMMIAMLIATALGLHNEAQNVRLEERRQVVRRTHFG